MVGSLQKGLQLVLPLQNKVISVINSISEVFFFLWKMRSFPLDIEFLLLQLISKVSWVVNWEKNRFEE